MSFPRYPKYKNSDIQWLGSVPKHWEIRKLKNLAQLESGHTPSRQRPEYWVEKDCVIPWFTLADVSFLRDGRNSIIERTSQKISHLGMANSAARLLPPETVLLSRTASVGFSGVTKVALAVSQDFAAWICGPRILPRYLLLCLRAMKQEFQRLMMGSTHQTIYMPDIEAFRVPVPPLTEQIAIATFLDRETFEIDALIAEQQLLIGLLREKRQAVISRAVTKGLNPNAPMKPSGIQWLGEVPVHWTLKKIKHLARSIEQGWSPQCEGFPVESENEWGVLKVGCVNGGTFNPSENKLLPAELKPIPTLTICRDDLLISRANTRELVGSAAVARQDWPNLMLCDKLYRVRFNRGLCCPWFVSLYLGSIGVRGQIELAATGASSSMLNIGQSAIMELFVPTPEYEEQRAIVEFLGEEADKLDALTAEAQRSIDLLQERRAAIISAAVTGKIDVRAFAERKAA